MGWIRGLTQILWFFVGIGRAAPDINNNEDVKTIGDYEDMKNATDFGINIQQDWDIKDYFCRLLAHTSEDIPP